MGGIVSSSKPGVPVNWNEPLMIRGTAGKDDELTLFAKGDDAETDSSPTTYYIFGPPEGELWELAFQPSKDWGHRRVERMKNTKQR